MSSVLGSRFVSKVHPYFVPNGREGRFLRRRGYNPELREELLAEAQGLAWVAWRHDPRCRQYPGKLSRYSTLQAIQGRKVCGVSGASLDGGYSSNARANGYRPKAWNNARVHVVLGRLMLNLSEDRDYGALEAFECVADPRRDLPPDTAQLRLDFRAWFATLPARDQKLLIMVLTDRSASGGRIARRFRISEGRVSQLRRALRESYERYANGDRNTNGKGK